MLPSASRMRRSSDFTATVRRGSRARRGVIVIHHLPDPDGAVDPARVGFVVSRAVGSSTTRHRVVRRLRHAVRARLDTLAPGSATVVRALPGAGEARFAELEADVSAALQAACHRAGAGAAR